MWKGISVSSSLFPSLHSKKETWLSAHVQYLCCKIFLWNIFWKNLVKTQCFCHYQDGVEIGTPAVWPTSLFLQLLNKFCVTETGAFLPSKTQNFKFHPGVQLHNFLQKILISAAAAALGIRKLDLRGTCLDFNTCVYFWPIVSSLELSIICKYQKKNMRNRSQFQLLRGC